MLHAQFTGVQRRLDDVEGVELDRLVVGACRVQAETTERHDQHGEHHVDREQALADVQVAQHRGVSVPLGAERNSRAGNG
jgi:hypothetical protein